MNVDGAGAGEGGMPYGGRKPACGDRGGVSGAPTWGKETEPGSRAFDEKVVRTDGSWVGTSGAFGGALNWPWK